MKSFKLESTADAGILIAVLLLAGFLIAWPLLGLWEAVRGFLAELVVLAAMFYIARQYLPWEDAPRERIASPKRELALAAVGFAVFFIAWPLLLPVGDVEALYLNLMFAAAALLAFTAAALLPFRYSLKAWGLRWPTGRELLVLLAVAAVGIGLSLLLGSLLPASEAPEMATPARPLMPGALLWSFWRSAAQDTSSMGLVLGVFLLSVIGQELYFRVYLQARLAHYLPGRWALFAQAGLYFAASLLPLYLLDGGLPPAFTLTQAAVLSNGVLAGYFWRKTGSLPLLVLLHLLAFVRWGL